MGQRAGSLSYRDLSQSSDPVMLDVVDLGGLHFVWFVVSRFVLDIPVTAEIAIIL